MLFFLVYTFLNKKDDSRPHPHITYMLILILSSNVGLGHPTCSALKNYCENFCMQFSSARARPASDHLSHVPWHDQWIPEDLLFSSSSCYFLHYAEMFSSAKHFQASPHYDETIHWAYRHTLRNSYRLEKKRLNCSNKQALSRDPEIRAGDAGRQITRESLNAIKWRTIW
jgi:hypothetical protein